MIFIETKLKGSYIIDLQPVKDDRGMFSRTFCRQEFEAHGLVSKVVQCNLSFNHHKGTLRGMHFQAAPFQEVKLVRCTMGSVYDVILDLRPDSPTYKQWVGVELTQANHRAIYIPHDFAHGYQTLVDDAEIFYQVSAPYDRNSAREVRWNDPAFGIVWPEVGELTMSDKDRNCPDFKG